jgi:hypothetical protein
MILQNVSNDYFPVVREDRMEMVSRTAPEVKDAILRP